MKSQRYMITTTVKGRVRNRVWDAAHPLPLDYPFHYVIENTSKGLRVRELNAGTRFSEVQCVKITRELLKNGSVIQLKGHAKSPDAKFSDGGSSAPMLLQVRPLASIHPLFSRQKKTSAHFERYSISACLNDHIVSSELISSTYTGKVQGEAVFRVTRKVGQYEFKILHGTLEFKTMRSQETARQGETRTINGADLLDLVIHSGNYAWHFNGASEPEVLPFVPPMADIETEFFRKTLISGAIFLAVAVGITVLVSPGTLTPPLEKVAPQAFKISLPKKPKTEGDTKAGDLVPKPAVVEPAGAAGEPKKAEKPKEVVKEVVKMAPPAPKAVAKTAAPKVMAKPAAPVKPIAPPTRARPPGLAAGKIKAEKVEIKKGPSAQAMRMQSMVTGMLSGSVGSLVNKNSLVKEAGSSGAAKMDVGTTVNGMNAVGVGALHAASNTGVGTLGGDSGGAEGNGAGGGSGKGSVGYGKGTQAGFGGAGVAGVGGAGQGVSLDVANATVEEGLTKDEVGEVIHKHMSEVRYCYEASMLRAPRVEGKISIAFKISGKGLVKTAGVQSSNIPDGKLQDCITKRLMTWKFPLPRGGVNVDVTYPFILKTLGGG
ncbi:MAG: AgmX/PglI C-terminal domain-containing protein [Methylotenera sp.]|nr:AgmX/PglI C-terminal domain-containing protein [Oligoflexia bacterium]